MWSTYLFSYFIFLFTTRTEEDMEQDNIQILRGASFSSAWQQQQPQQPLDLPDPSSSSLRSSPNALPQKPSPAVTTIAAISPAYDRENFPCNYPGCERVYSSVRRLNNHIIACGHGTPRAEPTTPGVRRTNVSSSSSSSNNPNATPTPRRRQPWEVPRPFTCDWNACDRSYSTLGNLNAHVRTHEHGPTRTVADFLEPGLSRFRNMPTVPTRPPDWSSPPHNASALSSSGNADTGNSKYQHANASNAGIGGSKAYPNSNAMGNAVGRPSSSSFSSTSSSSISGLRSSSANYPPTPVGKYSSSAALASASSSPYPAAFPHSGQRRNAAKQPPSSLNNHSSSSQQNEFANDTNDFISLADDSDSDSENLPDDGWRWRVVENGAIVSSITTSKTSSSSDSQLDATSTSSVNWLYRCCFPMCEALRILDEQKQSTYCAPHSHPKPLTFRIDDEMSPNLAVSVEAALAHITDISIGWHQYPKRVQRSFYRYLPPRFIVRINSADTIPFDGYDWRVFSQHGPCARFRCVHPGCTARRRVLKHFGDSTSASTTIKSENGGDIKIKYEDISNGGESFLEILYTGMHNHPTVQKANLPNISTIIGGASAHSSSGYQNLNMQQNLHQQPPHQNYQLLPEMNIYVGKRPPLLEQNAAEALRESLHVPPSMIDAWNRRYINFIDCEQKLPRTNFAGEVGEEPEEDPEDDQEYEV